MKTILTVLLLLMILPIVGFNAVYSLLNLFQEGLEWMGKNFSAKSGKDIVYV